MFIFLSNVHRHNIQTYEQSDGSWKSDATSASTVNDRDVLKGPDNETRVKRNK